MRLREFQQVLRLHVPVMVEGSAFSGAGGNQAFRIKGYAKAMAGLAALATIPPFRDAASGLVNSGLFAEPIEGDEFPVPGQIYNTVKPRVDSLNVRAKDLLDTLDAILGTEEETSFAFRLPDGVRDVAALVKATEEIQQVIDDSLVSLGCDRTRFSGFDRGSQWIELLADAKGLMVVAGIYAAANKVVADVLRHKRQLQEIEAADLENEERRQIIKTHKLLNTKLRRAEAKRVAGSVLPDASAEVVSKIAVAIERLARLIMRGAEVRLALGASGQPKEQEAAAKLVRETIVKELGGTIAQLGAGAVDDDGEAGEESKSDW